MAIDTHNRNATSVWKSSPLWWVVLGASGFLLIFPFYDGLAEMVRMWNSSEEYGYGFLIPPLVVFFIWQKKDQLAQIEFNGSWIGLIVVIAGLLLLLLGELSSLFILVQYAFVAVLFGLVLSLSNRSTFLLLIGPLLLLLFMIPLPGFFFNNLSQQLQLISSELGVAFIRALGVSVYLEGNVIDLGTYKLQVVEACSGLRYLFPLAALSYMAAYIFKGAFWKKVVIFISSVPITVFMNSFRIGVIGVLVDRWGIEQAEGFLHYFEGWVIFMACMMILIGEMWLLTRMGPRKQRLQDAFAIDLPSEQELNPGEVRTRTLPAPFVLSVVLVALAGLSVSAIEQREERTPERMDFVEFPMRLGDWLGHSDRLDQIYLDTLQLEDYLLVDYKNVSGDKLNLYAAYYESQRKGASIHSPRSCLPGGGWVIKEFSQRTIEGASIGGVPLRVNRALIRKGDASQLVYYWFQQRGRVITNEYVAKWYLFWDALTRNRTDGALVRLMTLVPPGGNVGDADQALSSFAVDVTSALSAYIPN